MLFIVFYILYVYALFFVIFAISQLIRRKRAGWWLLTFNLICIALFVYLQYLVEEHRLILAGEYTDATYHWGKGMANVYTTVANMAWLLVIFAVIQIAFWLYYNRKMKKLGNRSLHKHFLTTDSRIPE